MTVAAGPEQSMLEREVMSWQDVGTGARDLAEQVHRDGYRPDIVLGIARGGLLDLATRVRPPGHAAAGQPQEAGDEGDRPGDQEHLVPPALVGQDRRRNAGGDESVDHRCIVRTPPG